MNAMMIDVVAGLGVVLVCIGVFLLCGTGWACIAAGSMLIIAAVLSGYNNARGAAGG